MAENRRNLTIRITGMTCVNCQGRITAALRGVDGVLQAEVRYEDGTARVDYDPARIDRAGIEAAVTGLGYGILREDAAGQRRNMVRVGALLLVILFLYLLLSQYGILNLLVPGQLAGSGMGYGMLLVTGLLTSVHCVAMCGGISLSQSLRGCGVASEGRFAVMRSSLLYNLGRILSYTLIGGVLGGVGMLLGIGTDIALSNLLQGGIKLLAGALMVLMGANMLCLVPPLRKLAPHPPAHMPDRRAHSGAFAVGLLNGLMPCGPLQSMQLVALATGNPLSGALSMLFFSLGTVPLMLGLGSIVSALGTRFTKQVRTAGAVLVTVMGFAMLSQGGSLSGLLSERMLLLLVLTFCAFCMLMNIPVRSRAVRGVAGALTVCTALVLLLCSDSTTGTVSGADSARYVRDGVQVVESTLQSGQYPDIEVEAGIPVKWIITAPEGSINGCNYKIYISEYDIEYTLSEGENIITFTPEEGGTYSYSCWMGMITGEIIVTEQEESS